MYAVSKTLAEQAAWKFAKENGIDLITIHPGVTVGPLLQPTINDSVKQIVNLLNGIIQQLIFIITLVSDNMYIL